MSTSRVCRLFRLSALILATLAMFGCGRGGIRGPGSDFADSHSLFQHNDRGVSTAPSGPANQITDLTLVDNGDGTFNILWRYRCLGDYNQDGSVGVPDITSIAMLYGQDAPADQPNSLQAVTDGSGNQKIDVSDVTPIAMYFGVSCAGFIIEGSAIQDGIYTQTQDLPLSDAIGMGRKQFNVRLDNIAYKYCRVRPYDTDGIPGVESNIVTLPGPPPPVAPSIVSVYPKAETEGSMIQVNAVVTGDAPITYAWDFGDGATPNTSTDASPTITLGPRGDYSAQLTVSNTAGQDVYIFPLKSYLRTGRGEWWACRHDMQLSARSVTIGPSKPKQAWRFGLTDASYCAVEDSIGRIAISSGGWSFYVLDMLGQQVWAFPAGVDLTGAPAIREDGSFIIGSSDGNLYCIDPGEGEIRWSYNTGDEFAFTTPALAPDGTVAVFSSYMNAYADFYILTPQGVQVTRIAADYHKGGIAVGLDGTFYWATKDMIFGYDTTGNQVLAHPFERSVSEAIQSISVNPQGEIVVVATKSISAYDPDGQLTWDIDIPQPQYYSFTGSPALGPDGEVYVRRTGHDDLVDYYDSTHAFGWQYLCSEEVSSPPIVDGEGKVYFGDVIGNVFCLSPQGYFKWSWTSAAGLENAASMSISSTGLLLVPAGDGYLYAVEQDNTPPPGRGEWWTFGGNEKRNSRSQYVGPKTNHKEWDYDSAYLGYRHPIIGSDGSIYITTGLSLLALKPDGTKDWQASLSSTRAEAYLAQGPDGTVFASATPNLLGTDTTGSGCFSVENPNGWRGCPIVDEQGRVFAVSSNNVFGFDAAGSFLWQNPVSGTDNSSPVLGEDGTVYYADRQGIISSMDPASGSCTTFDSGPNYMDFGIAVGDDGKLYGPSGKDLRCIDPGLAGLAWAYTASANLCWLPAIAPDGTLFIGDINGNIYHVDSSGNGDVYYSAGGTVGQCTLDADGTLYFFAGTVLYAVSSDGLLLWQFDAGTGDNSYSAPAIAPDGTLYFGSNSGKLYALKDEVT